MSNARTYHDGEYLWVWCIPCQQWWTEDGYDPSPCKCEGRRKHPPYCRSCQHHAPCPGHEPYMHAQLCGCAGRIVIDLAALDDDHANCAGCDWCDPPPSSA